MKNDLERLENQVSQLLKDGGFAEFKSEPRGPDMPMIHWDTENYPDPATFLQVAGQLEIKLVCHSADVFHVAALDESIEAIRKAGVAREEIREFERELKRFRGYEGFLCDVELSFDFEGRVYCYDSQAPWYDEYLELMDRIDTILDFEDGDDDDDPSPGPGPLGYFSRN